MPRYVLANWKSHKTLAEVEAWLETFLAEYSPDPEVEVIIAPSFVHLHPMGQRFKQREASHLHLAAQDLSPFPLGSYTGAVSAAQLQGLAEYVIVGHMERRRYFHETHRETSNKVGEALAVGLCPIVCVDQPYAGSLYAALNEVDMEELFIGYAPVEAIGLDNPQSPEKTARAIKEISSIAPHTPILYGGSLNEENAAEYIKLPGVSGLILGTASLDAREFAAICRLVARTGGD